MYIMVKTFGINFKKQQHSYIPARFLSSHSVVACHKSDLQAGAVLRKHKSLSWLLSMHVVSMGRFKAIQRGDANQRKETLKRYSM